MSQYETVFARYLEVWNESNAERRLELLRANWAEDAQYYDPLSKAEGRVAISRLIGTVHSQFPGFRFHAVGTADGYQQHVRFSWELGPAADERAPIAGSDTVTLTDDGRVLRVIGFLDRVPAAPDNA